MSTARRRVAVTGIGLVTPLGNDRESTWSALVEGKSGIGPIATFDASGFPVRIAAEVRGFDAAAAIGDRKLAKYAGRYQAFGLGAAAEALDDAGIRPGPETAERWACVVGSGMLGVAFEDLRRLGRAHAPRGHIDPASLFADDAAFDPVAFCRSHGSNGLALLQRRFGIRGPAAIVHTACASGGQAVGMAMKLVRRGTVDWALTGGLDSMIGPTGLSGFCLLSALSTDNEAPERASRPFDRTRNGFVLGEGAGFLVLEEWERARSRGARIYAELAGEGTSLSSYRITDSHPSGDGPIQAIRRALRDAEVAADEIDYVNAHGTSTAMNDRSECAAIRRVFGSHADALRVSSTKSSMGHLIAAAGAVEAAISALAVHTRTLPANRNLEDPDPECDLPFVRVAERRARVRAALSNSFGFGGSNSALVLRAADGGA